MKPTLSCQAAIVLNADQQCKAKVPRVLPSVTDNCDMDILLEQDKAVDSILGLGNTDVTIYAADKSSNTVNISICKILRKFLGSLHNCVASS